MLRQNYEQVLFEDTLPIKVLVQQLDSYKLHWHSQPELLYAVKGSFAIRVGSENCTLNMGDMLYIDGEALHSVNKLSNDNLLIAIQFNSDFFSLAPELKKCYFRISAFLRDQQEKLSIFSDLQRLIIDLVWQYNKQPRGYRYQLAAIAYHILAMLIRHDYFSESPLLSPDQEHSLLHINRIVDYINLHYADNISLQEIADQEHVSYYHLSHIFKSITGLTFRDHLRNVRLHNSTKALKANHDSILNIALNHGFSSVKNYSNAFKARYGITPGEYRAMLKDVGSINNANLEAFFEIGNENSLLYSSVNSDADLSYIYSLKQIVQSDTITSQPWHVDVSLNVDMNSATSPLRHTWSRIGSCSRAGDMLKAEVREQIAFAVKELGIQYLRFHGIFCDDMMVFNRRNDGTIVYNWLYVDIILDFLHQLHVHPFLELDFMPTELATTSNTIFFYRANISKPASLDIWADMVRALFQHCMNRYGAEEVNQWYVEVWNEPDYQGVFWDGNVKDYLDLYEASVKAVKDISPAIRVGGPAITTIDFNVSSWVADLLHFCTERQLPCDFISYHLYSDLSAAYSYKGNDMFPRMSKYVNFIKDMEKELIQTHTHSAEQCGYPKIEQIISEWNVSAKPRFIIRDLAFMAPYLASVALKCRDMVGALTYWCISDMIEELKAPTTLFHGGLGMITTQGVPKSSFWGMRMLHMLGDQTISSGDHYIITKRGHQYQILMYNLVMLDQMAQRNLDFSSEYVEDPYKLFEEQPALRFLFHLSNMSEDYRVVRYDLNRQAGSAYDCWKAMGQPASLQKDELTYLHQASTPHLQVFYAPSQNNAIDLEIDVPIHGCSLLILTPRSMTD